MSERLLILLLCLPYLLIPCFIRKRSAFIVGISFVTFLSWFRNTAVTYFPDDPAGDERFNYFKKIVSIEPIDQLLARFTSELGSVGVALITVRSIFIQSMPPLSAMMQLNLLFTFL